MGRSLGLELVQGTTLVTEWLPSVVMEFANQCRGPALILCQMTSMMAVGSPIMLGPTREILKIIIMIEILS